SRMRSSFSSIRHFSSAFQGVKESARYVPRRALLYVPASSEKMLAKVPSIQADSVVIELEDGVAIAAKDSARKNAAAALDKLAGQPRKAFEIGVRVNSVSSGMMEDDLRVLARAQNLPDAFMIPKVDSPEDLAYIFDVFKKEYTPSRVTDTKTRMVMWIESARALLDMPRIVSTALNLHKSTGFFKLDAVVFGSDDYCADIGATRTSEGLENLYARQRFVACCKAFQVQAIDSVYIDLKDEEGLRKYSEQGRNWGFTGKQTIHPSQVPIVQSSFLPSTERIEWARALAEEYGQHQKEGKGAFSFRGQMIDRPLLLQAMNIIQLDEAVKEAANK
ncbi:hypothetical protein PMAYCL1PPCAC_30028, partial [Pristionchus mayeri]